MDTQSVDLSGLTSFYRSMLKVWRTLSISRNLRGSGKNPWYNSTMDLEILKPASVRNALRNAGEGWMSYKLGVRSVCLTQRLLNDLLERLTTDFKLGMETPDEDTDAPFPELCVPSGFPNLRCSVKREKGSVDNMLKPHI